MHAVSFNLLPSDWRAVLTPRLGADEIVRACAETDLSADLRFVPGLLVLTSLRLLHVHRDGSCQEWAIDPALSLRLSDHAGVGLLEVLRDEARIGLIRFGLVNYSAVSYTATELERLRAGGDAAEPTQALCPECGGPLDPATGTCPACAREADVAPSTWTLFRLWHFARPYKRLVFLGFFFTLSATFASLVPPYLTMPLMDEVLIPFQAGQQIDQSKVVLYLGGLLGAALLAWGLAWGKTFTLALVAERVGADLRTTAFNHLLTLSLEYFGGKRTGDLVSRLGNESDRISVFLSLYALDFVTDCLMILMTAAILFSINPELALATLIPLPIIGWMIHVVRDRLRTGFDKLMRVWSEVANVLSDTIPGIRVVKAFAQEERESKRFLAANQYNLALNDRLNRLWGLFSPTVTLLTEVGLLIVWAFGISLIAKQEITVGVLTAFIAYIGRFYTRLDSMSRIVAHTQKAASAAKRIFDVLDHVSSVPEPRNPVPLPAVTGRIDLKAVGFRYGNRQVLRDVELAIQPGEMIGLVGQSGSGKSTLVNLICRFYDVSEGAVQLDGVDIRDLALSTFRKHIGLVLQEPFLFFGTIADNIAYGKPNATREEIVAAAKAAHAHDFVLRLPQAYDSLVGERGQGLSGGERQRISIARALLIDPRILILDEATSSVDTETEKEIQKALENLVRGRTTIAVAHRLSTLRKADRLVVLERGKVVEIGPHDELIEKDGVYARLYEAQTRQQAEEIA